MGVGMCLTYIVYIINPDEYITMRPLKLIRNSVVTTRWPSPLYYIGDVAATAAFAWIEWQILVYYNCLLHLFCVLNLFWTFLQLYLQCKQILNSSLSRLNKIQKMVNKLSLKFHSFIFQIIINPFQYFCCAASDFTNKFVAL